MCWTCVKKLWGHKIRHFVAAGRFKSSLNIKKLWKTAFLGLKNCAKSSWPKIKVWNEGKRCGYMLCLPQDCISSIFGPVIPSKQPKNAKIWNNRLFLGDFGFHNQRADNINCIAIFFHRFSALFDKFDCFGTQNLLKIAYFGQFLHFLVVFRGWLDKKCWKYSLVAGTTYSHTFPLIPYFYRWP